ncbi:MAG: MFS transporter [Parachlamydiaceae bacterium]|nr:MFS transporter [Parachlamydiaceae bacterium]
MTAKEKSQARMATLMSSLGAGFEYYDFIIYGMMAEYLRLLFFAGDDSWVGSLKTFAIFAVGYFARPFGGIFFGIVGDTIGRKKTFLTVMLLMATSTFGIGLLPTYKQVGNIAPLLLVLMRLLQGFSFGAELPGAMTVVYEFSKQKDQSAHAGFVLASTSLGAMLASGVLYFVSATFVHDQIFSWGWRIPFLLGGVLAVVNYFIRRHLNETPEFLLSQVKADKTCLRNAPLKCILREHLSSLILGIGMTLFVSSLIILGLYFPTFLTTNFGYSSSSVYLALLWSMVASAVTLPICGRFADKVGRERLFIMSSLAYVLGAFPLFSVLKLEANWALQLFMVLHQIFIALVSVCYFPLLAASFPTRVRYTGIAACYNITYSFMATLPILLTGLIYWTGSADSVILVMMGCAALSGLSAYYCINLYPSFGALSSSTN